MRCKHQNFKIVETFDVTATWFIENGQMEKDAVFSPDYVQNKFLVVCKDCKKSWVFRHNSERIPAWLKPYTDQIYNPPTDGT